MGTITEFILKCLRCQHHWLPRGAYHPVQCPRCKSKVWNKAKEVKTDADAIH